jgi:uroporphyrinogen-III synthase
LTEAGYQIERVKYYEAFPLTQLDVDIKKVVYVALYSPRGAANFVNLIQKKDVGHLTTLSISAVADAALEPLRLQNRLIAEAPDQSSMLAALRSHTSHLISELKG